MKHTNYCCLLLLIVLIYKIPKKKKKDCLVISAKHLQDIPLPCTFCSLLVVMHPLNLSPKLEKLCKSLFWKYQNTTQCKIHPSKPF